MPPFRGPLLAASACRGGALLLAAPPLLLGSTRLAFRRLGARFGLRRGYFGGFALYWLGWCAALPLAALGPRRARALLRPAPPPSRRPTRGEWLALALPPLLAYTTAFPRALRQASPRVVLASAALALVNATAEEVLWRGAYQARFAGRPVAGYLYPAAGFAAWHLAPQALVPSRLPGGAASFVAGAGLFGLLWGGVAARTGSIRWTLASHALTDFAGLGARVYFVGAAPHDPARSPR